MSSTPRRPAAPLVPALALALAALVAAVFLPAGSHPFIGFDDPDYVTGNAVVREGLTARGVAWAFTSLAAANWHPLAWLSHMADVELFGLDAGRHHLVSVALHGANALLLFLLLARATASPWRSALAAALFAVHPLRVESVAWVSERKDLLCAAFLLLAFHAYLPRGVSPRPRRPAAVALLVALALMAKPTAVTAPLLLLLLDGWPLGRLRSARDVPSLLAEKAPLFVLSAASAAVTLHAARQGGALRGLGEGPFTAGARLGNAVASAGTYLWKTAFPSGLAPFYPYPKGGPSPGTVLLSAAALALATAAVLRWRRRIPALPAGWGWFLAALVPVLGIVQVGDQALADRYTYLPHMGLFLAAAWAVPEAGALPVRWRPVPALACVAAVAALSLACRHQLSYWKGDRELFVHALAVTSPGWTPPPDPAPPGEEPRIFPPVLADALRKNPNFERAYYGLAEARKREGRTGEAILAYREALRVDPSLKVFHNNLAGLLLARGDADGAAFHYEEAIRLDPALAEPRFNRAALLARRGAWGEAAAAYREALRLRPDDADGHFNLAEVLRLGGRPAEAVPHYREALRLRPGDPLGLRGLAESLGAPEGGAGRPTPLDTTGNTP